MSSSRKRRHFRRRLPQGNNRFSLCCRRDFIFISASIAKSMVCGNVRRNNAPAANYKFAPGQSFLKIFVHSQEPGHDWHQPNPAMSLRTLDDFFSQLPACRVAPWQSRINRRPRNDDHRCNRKDLSFGDGNGSKAGLHFVPPPSKPERLRKPAARHRHVQRNDPALHQPQQRLVHRDHPFIMTRFQRRG